MSLYILGDIHFSASRPWRLPLGDAFLTWLRDLSYIDSERDELLILGDLSDDAVNPGKVVRQLETLASICSEKFKATWILKGNHDEKLYKGSPQLSFEFLGLKNSFSILETPAEVVDLCGLKTLSLPFYNYRTDLPSLWEYYAALPEDISSQSFDLIIGHFANTSAAVFESQVNLTYLKSQLIALGHVHTRVSQDYLGSVFPCKISENSSPLPRAMWKVDKRGSKVVKEEILLPTFCEYKFATYPAPLPATSPNIVTIWTIANCEVEAIAKAHYPDAFIRGVASDFTRKTDKGVVASDSDFHIKDYCELFNNWIKESKANVSRPAAKLVKQLLSPAQNTSATN